MRKVEKVEVLGGYQLKLTFDDGISGTVDLADLAGKGIFTYWQDPSVFAGVRIGSMGELVWGDRIDLCPDALYLQITGKSPEDLFPGLRREAARA